MGYRVYRGARMDDGPYALLATLPPNITAYTDHSATCDQAYYVTAFNAAGESWPSTSSYYTPPCAKADAGMAKAVK